MFTLRVIAHPVFTPLGQTSPPGPTFGPLGKQMFSPGAKFKPLRVIAHPVFTPLGQTSPPGQNFTPPGPTFDPLDKLQFTWTYVHSCVKLVRNKCQD
jgi:hypothetical protein